MVQLLGVGCATSIHSPMEGCKTFQLKPDAQGWADAIVAELFVTLMLALVVPSVVTESRRLSQFFGVAIRMCAAIGGCVTGKISERSVNPEAYRVNGIAMGCVNPAGALGIDVSSADVGLVNYLIDTLLPLPSSGSLVLLKRVRK